MQLPITAFRQPTVPLLGTAKVRVAQITHGAHFHSADTFPPNRWDELEEYAPNILVGSAGDLHRLVKRVDLHTVTLTTIDHAIYVLTEVGDKPLDDVLRVVLWQRFGVPVFEIYTDGCGSMIAHECEAQEGWHLVPGTLAGILNGELVVYSGSRPIRTGLVSFFIDHPCGCGRPGMRAMLVSEFASHAERPVLAATA